MQEVEDLASGALLVDYNRGELRLVPAGSPRDSSISCERLDGAVRDVLVPYLRKNLTALHTATLVTYIGAHSEWSPGVALLDDEDGRLVSRGPDTPLVWETVQEAVTWAREHNYRWVTTPHLLRWGHLCPQCHPRGSRGA